jgi:hypothetical protein
MRCLVCCWLYGTAPPIHRGQVVKDFLTNGSARRLWIESFQEGPGYAPELNPDEGIWQYLKYVELRNRCCSDIPDLRRELGHAAARLRHKPAVIHACIQHAGYHV